MEERKLKQLKIALETENKIREEINNKKVVFEEANKELFYKLTKVTEHIELFKDNIRIQALKEYGETNQKQLLGGIGIRVGTELEYEAEEALAWAKEHSLCLQLDQAAFKKIAKQVEFVQVKEKITVTFPKKIIV